MTIGLLLIAAALCLTGVNLVTEHIAGKKSEAILTELRAKRKQLSHVKQEIPPEHDTTYSGGEVSTDTTVPETSAPETEPIKPSEVEIPDYVIDPNMEMPTFELDGEEYVGVLDIPKLELSLPIIDEWSYPRLKLTACRYEGSVYLDDMILVGHNYRRHFGKLSRLSIGDELYFTDTLGNYFGFEVVEIETLPGTAIAEMSAGDWDLTLFTCTMSGRTRLTIRCDRISDTPAVN